jgi:tetratricopeptide (TPR) repeat protein
MGKLQFDEGLSQYQAGDYQAARDTFLQLTAVAPHQSEAWLNLGNACFRLNDLQQAESHWRKAIELDPLEANGYLNLGNLYFKQERFASAVEAWETFKQLKPVNPKIWLNLGLAYDKLGKVSEAVEHYSRYIQLDRTSEDSIKLQARFRSARKFFDTCMQVAEKAMMAGRTEQAMDAFGKALACYPGTAKVYKTYASLLYRQGDEENALAHYLAAWERSPDDAGVLTNLGVLYEKRRQPVDALWAYGQAAQKPGKDRMKVVERYERLSKTHQDKLADFLDEGFEMLGKGDPMGAKTRFQRLEELDRLYAPDQQQQIRKGLQQVEEARNPVLKAARAYYGLAEDARRSGRYDQALVNYTKYLEIQPMGEHAEAAKQHLEALRKQMAAVVTSFLKTDATGQSR